MTMKEAIEEIRDILGGDDFTCHMTYRTYAHPDNRVECEILHHFDTDTGPEGIDLYKAKTWAGVVARVKEAISKEVAA